MKIEIELHPPTEKPNRNILPILVQRTNKEYLELSFYANDNFIDPIDEHILTDVEYWCYLPKKIKTPHIEYAFHSNL